MSQDLCSALHCNICLMLQARDSNYQHNARCDSKKVDLNNCTGCKLVKYCSRSHQKIDWPIHRDFCQAIQKIKSVLKISHPFLVSGEPKCKEDIEQTIVNLKYLLRNALERPLEFQEEELTSNPVYCPICFQFKNVKTLCPDCLNQAYCSEKHLMEDKNEHMKVCGLLQIYYTPFKTIQVENHDNLVLKQRVDELQNADLVEAFQTAFQCKLPEKPTRSLEDYKLFAHAADFSCIFTICYALCHVDMSSLVGTSFVAFIIGASVEPVLWFRSIHCKFFFLQYPQITHLDLHFIGPEVIASEYEIIQFDYMDAERTINFHSYKGLFQTYCQYFKVKPSIILAFNCGFSEFAQLYNSAPKVTNLNELEMLEITDEVQAKEDTWFHGLVEILQTFSTPIIFTSFTKQESDFDFAALQEAAQQQLLKVHIERIFNVSQNPFRDLRPLRQWYVRDHESFYYRNGYIQAIRTKLMT